MKKGQWGKRSFHFQERQEGLGREVLLLYSVTKLFKFEHRGLFYATVMVNTQHAFGKTHRTTQHKE